jgi:hypothetical protein
MAKLLRILGILVLVLVGLLLVVRVVGSPIATNMVNRKLAELPDYMGNVGGVHLALWRGTVTVSHFALFRRGQEAAGPVVVVRQASLALSIFPLFTGKVGGRGTIDGMEIVILKTEPDKPKKDDDKGPPPIRQWSAVLRDAFPIEITRFEVENARIHFADRSVTPAAEMVIDQFKLVATDLSNRPKGEDLPAHVTVQARVGGTGRLDVDVRADPSAPQPRFTVRMEVKDLQLVPIHDFLLHFALIDVSAGSFEVFSEINAADGHYDGYLKPFFKDLQFKAVPDPSKNFAQRVATTIAAAVTDLLKNDKGDVATKAPFKGDFEDNQVEVWTAIQNLLRNAFVQSLFEGLEGQTPS